MFCSFWVLLFSPLSVGESAELRVLRASLGLRGSRTCLGSPAQSEIFQAGVGGGPWTAEIVPVIRRSAVGLTDSRPSM